MSRPRILIVEDEVVVARDIHEQLDALGFEAVGEARTGEEALALVTKLQPDLVLMDIKLGSGMDGVTAALTLRERNGPPVVFLSAFAADDILARAALAEPYGYMLKPFSERELRTVLQMALYKHQAETKARDQDQYSQAILDNMANGVITVNAQGLIESFSKGAGELFAYAPAEVLGQSVSMLMPESLHSLLTNYLQAEQTKTAGQAVTQPREVQGLRKDGSTFPVTLVVSRIWRAGRPTYVGILTDLSQHQEAQKKIHNLAFFDELTGLPNRRRLLDRLKQAITACARLNQVGALVFLDLDHFRHINETLGPGFGDDLLREAAQRLRLCVREDDTVAHFGGDEFMVMLDTLGPDLSVAAARAEATANQILHALRQSYHLHGHAYTSSASVGIVLFDQKTQDIDELLKMADAAMYQAKGAGRNTVRFYDPAMQAQAVARTELERDMQRGLTQQEFVLHYQLQVDANGNPVGAEALVRWQHPQRQLVPPSEFIAMAEETGLILQLGQWVLAQACHQLVQWATHPDTAHWTMAVNVSALQFAQADFVDSVVQAIQASGANPNQLKLELTESMLVGDVADVIAKMRRIKALGVSFSLDDFGTGYSSLTYLKRLPLDQLKIDKSFVRDLLVDHDDAVIAQAIVSLGHNLGMQVIAEGVETEGQRACLAKMGCDAFQGYLFSRPAAPSELPHFLVK